MLSPASIFFVYEINLVYFFIDILMVSRIISILQLIQLP